MDVCISLFLLPPVVHMVIPGSPHHLSSKTIHKNTSVVLRRNLCTSLYKNNHHYYCFFIHTLSFHESVDVAVPVSRFWLGQGHAIKVIVRDYIVFGIASHIDYLWKKIISKV